MMEQLGVRVGETVIRNLSAALQEAANKPNIAQSEMNARRVAFSQAKENAQRASTQQVNAVALSELIAAAYLDIRLRLTPPE